MKTPLSYENNLILDADGKVVVDFEFTDVEDADIDAHAAFIVAACNGRDALTRACGRIVSWLDDLDGRDDGLDGFESLMLRIEECRAALAE